MKVCVKKVRCPYCETMVKCTEQQNNSLVNIICPKCKKYLYAWNGVYWRTIRT